MRHTTVQYNDRIRALQSRSDSMLDALQKNDLDLLARLCGEEQAAYQRLMDRLADEMNNAKSPALRRVAKVIHQYFLSMQQLATHDLARDIKCEDADEREAEEEAIGLMEE